MKSYCSTCNRQTNHKVLKEEKRFESDETGWWDENTFQIIECMGCDTVSFRQLYNDISRQSSTDEDTTTQELFPKRGVHSRPIKNYRNLPIDIKKVYLETIEAYNNKLTLLSSVGIRSIIEGICIEKQIKNGTFIDSNGKTKKSSHLDGKIYGLASNGYLTTENAELLHELRFLGNKAVHELSTPSLNELSLAIDIIELIIDNIYEVKYKAQSLKLKRITKK